MVALSNAIVEHIRVLYSSGLYHKADLAVRFSCYMENPLDIAKILDYNLFPDVRPDLRLKLFGINFIFEISDEYHHTLRVAAMQEFKEDISRNPKHTPEAFQIVKDRADKILEEKLKFINKEMGTTFTIFDIQSRIHTNF